MEKKCDEFKVRDELIEKRKQIETFEELTAFLEDVKNNYNYEYRFAKYEDEDSLYPNMFISLARGNGKRIMCDAIRIGDTYGIKTALNKIYGAPLPEIKNVIFNYPATIVFWTDGTKTVVKAQGDDVYDKEKGLAMAIAKKVLGTNESGSNYYDVFKKWIPEDAEEDNVKCYENSFAKIAEMLNKVGNASFVASVTSGGKSCSNCKYSLDTFRRCKLGEPRECIAYSDWEPKDE